MKKLTALIALALLAVAGTGLAVTCAQDNVPAATLLVPYFRVGGAGVVLPNDIPDSSGTDTLCAVTNTSSGSIIIHVTVFNKYSKGVLDFNVPMTGYDVVFWSMRDILNGKLNVNLPFQAKYTNPSNPLDTNKYEPCGQIYTAGGTVGYSIANTPYIRFPAADPNDRANAISVYATPAFSGSFRTKVWTSLDESADIASWTSGGAFGSGVYDDDNPACFSFWSNGTVSGDFSGYVVIDVVNNCTLHFPEQPTYYEQDSIATVGWGSYPGPNILVGDVFYKDQKPGDTIANTGNISGDPMVHIEFDDRLYWATNKTFYGKYFDPDDSTAVSALQAPYAFLGDGREPLGREYTFRYLQSVAPTTLRTWITVWRSDVYDINLTTASNNLCNWWGWNRDTDGSIGFAQANGLRDAAHKIIVSLWDNDENVISTSGGPSGGSSSSQYLPLEAMRIAVTPNTTIVPSNFYGGWIDLYFGAGYGENQAFVGVQHSGLGLAMSVGHAAQLKPGTGTCVPNPTMTFPLLPPGIIDNGALNQTN